MYKKSDGTSIGLNLHYLISVLKVLPISSADCERGFSQMNLFHTSGRNRLNVTSVTDSLMIAINGPLWKHGMQWNMSLAGWSPADMGLRKRPQVYQRKSVMYLTVPHYLHDAYLNVCFPKLVFEANFADYVSQIDSISGNALSYSQCRRLKCILIKQ